MVPEIWCATDGRTEKVTEVGAPPKNILKPFGTFSYG